MTSKIFTPSQYLASFLLLLEVFSLELLLMLEQSIARIRNFCIVALTLRSLFSGLRIYKHYIKYEQIV